MGQSQSRNANAARHGDKGEVAAITDNDAIDGEGRESLYRSRSTRSFADLIGVGRLRRGIRRVRDFFGGRSKKVDSYEIDDEGMASPSSSPTSNLEKSLEAQTLEDAKKEKEPVDIVKDDGFIHVQVHEVTTTGHKFDSRQDDEDNDEAVITDLTLAPRPTTCHDFPSALSPIPEVSVDSLELDSFQNSQREKRRDYLNFPFLNDPATINWIKHNRIIMVMRGLPGSGKSTLVNAIKDLYESDNAGDQIVICSADHFFQGPNGEYNFDAKKLPDAHEASQERMKQACREGKALVIVDNTNVMKWEMKTYFIEAQKARFTYRVIVIEPKTPWKLDPYELSVRNSHNVGLEPLLKRVKQFQVVAPIYYAWFLSPHDSRGLTDKCYNLLKTCFETWDVFKERFGKMTSMVNVMSAVNYYSRDMLVSGDKHIIHCTSKFCGFGGKKPSPGVEEFAGKPEVIDNLGRIQTLNIIGFFFTKDTFGARVELTHEQLELYDQDERLDVKSERQVGKPPKKSSSTGSENHDFANDDGDKKPFVTIKQGSSLVDEDEDDKQRFFPIPNRGRRAHLTIGTAEGVKAVQTGVDLLDIVRCERDFKESDEKSFHFDYSNGLALRHYEDKYLVLYPKTSITVQAMFTGFY